MLFAALSQASFVLALPSSISEAFEAFGFRVEARLSGQKKIRV